MSNDNSRQVKSVSRQFHEGQQVGKEIVDLTRGFQNVCRNVQYFLAYPWILTLHSKVGVRNVRFVPVLVNGALFGALAYFTPYRTFLVLAIGFPVIAVIQLVITRLHLRAGYEILSFDIGESHLLTFTGGYFKRTIDCVIEPIAMIVAARAFADFPAAIIVPAVCLGFLQNSLYSTEWHRQMDQRDQSISGKRLSKQMEEIEDRTASEELPVAEDLTVQTV